MGGQVRQTSSMSDGRAWSLIEPFIRATLLLLCIEVWRQAFDINVCLAKVAASFQNRTLPPFCLIFARS